MRSRLRMPRRSLLALTLVLSLVGLAGPAAAQVPPAGTATQFDITGALQTATVTAATPFNKVVMGFRPLKPEGPQVRLAVGEIEHQIGAVGRWKDTGRDHLVASPVMEVSAVGWLLVQCVRGTPTRHDSGRDRAGISRWPLRGGRDFSPIAQGP